MSVLILNAGTASPIAPPTQQASQGAPIYIGTKSQSFAGQERSSVRGIRRTWQVVTSQLTDAERASIESITSRGQQIPCSGDLLGGIQTQCSVEVTNVSGVQGLAFWILSLTLTEVTGSVVQLRLAAGETVTGESVTRSTVANQTDANGQLISKAINAKRDGHFRNGTRTILLEGARNNTWSNPEDLSNAVWTKTRATITANATAAPDAAVTGDKLVEDSSVTTDHNVGRSWSASTASTLQAWSYFAKAAERTWHRVRSFDRNGVVGNTYVDLVNAVLGAISGAAQTLRITNVLGTWRRIETTFDSASGASNPKFEVGLATGNNGAIYTGDGASGSYAWGFQCEIDAPFSSSYTTGARGADFYSLPYTAPPGEITAYFKFFERGTILTPGARVFEIASAVDADPRFLVFVSGGFYTVLHGNGVGTVTSGVVVAPAIGDTVEILARLFGDGSVDISQTINGAGPTSGGQTGANALKDAWSGQLLWLNSAGTVGSVGFVELQSFRIVAGVRSLSEMRAA
jgi:hypothetical protein